MITASILTKFIGPTNYLPSRVIAYNKNNKVKVTLTYHNDMPSIAGLSHEESIHANAAKLLAEKLGWTGDYVGGHLNQEGYVFVRLIGERLPGSDWSDICAFTV